MVIQWVLNGLSIHHAMRGSVIDDGCACKDYTGIYGEAIKNISKYAITVKILPSTGIRIIHALQ